MKKIPLVYIGGCGHSGSTLLDLILGSHPNIISVGEIGSYSFPYSINTCSCGKRALECDFWSEVNNLLSKKIKNDGREIKNNGLQKIPYLSFRNILKWNNIYYPELEDEERGLYLRDNKNFFSSILEISGKELVVDSSKIPTRALYLYESGKFKMKLIYLVRDGRAFVRSFHKKDEPNYKAASYWTLRNYRMRKIIEEKFNKNDFIKVFYEDLATNPEQEIKRILDFIELPFDKNVLNFRDVNHHIIGGNPMRSKKDDSIKMDKKWESSLSLLDKLVFNVIGGYLNKKIIKSKNVQKDI